MLGHRASDWPRPEADDHGSPNGPRLANQRGRSAQAGQLVGAVTQLGRVQGLERTVALVGKVSSTIGLCKSWSPSHQDGWRVHESHASARSTK